jgi:hypothetical protein
MATHRAYLLRDSPGLLRQVRSSMADDSNHGLAVSLDEVIVRLELYLSEGSDDPGRIVDSLKVLAQGLAAIPGLERLIETLRDR